MRRANADRSAGRGCVTRAGALPVSRAEMARRRAEARPTWRLARAQRQMKKQPNIDLSRLTCIASPSFRCTVLEKVVFFLTSSNQ